MPSKKPRSRYPRRTTPKKSSRKSPKKSAKKTPKKTPKKSPKKPTRKTPRKTAKKYKKKPRNFEPIYEDEIPLDEQPKPTYEQPKPTYEQPKPTYEQPKPTYEQPKPSYEQPKPSYEQPKPSYEKPKPAYEQPKPAYEKPKMRWDESDFTLRENFFKNQVLFLIKDSIGVSIGAAGFDKETNIIGIDLRNDYEEEDVIKIIYKKIVKYVWEVIKLEGNIFVKFYDNQEIYKNAFINLYSGKYKVCEITRDYELLSINKNGNPSCEKPKFEKPKFEKPKDEKPKYEQPKNTQDPCIKLLENNDIKGTAAEAKKLYIKWSRQNHPDKCMDQEPNNPDCEKQRTIKFQEVSNCYEKMYK